MYGYSTCLLPSTCSNTYRLAVPTPIKIVKEWTRILTFGCSSPHAWQGSTLRPCHEPTTELENPCTRKAKIDRVRLALHDDNNEAIVILNCISCFVSSCWDCNFNCRFIKSCYQMSVLPFARHRLYYYPFLLKAVVHNWLKASRETGVDFGSIWARIPIHT